MPIYADHTQAAGNPVVYEVSPPNIQADNTAIVRIDTKVDGVPLAAREVRLTQAEVGAIMFAPGDPALSIIEQVGRAVLQTLVDRGDVKGVIGVTPTPAP